MVCYKERGIWTRVILAIAVLKTGCVASPGTGCARDIPFSRRVLGNAQTFGSPVGGWWCFIGMLLLDIVGWRKIIHSGIVLPFVWRRQKPACVTLQDFPDCGRKNWRSICHAIEAHSFQRKVRPPRIEQKSLQGCQDRLEALGADGSGAESSAVSGALGVALFDADESLCRL